MPSQPQLKLLNYKEVLDYPRELSLLFVESKYMCGARLS